MAVLLGGSPERSLSADEVRESQLIGTWLTSQPASVYLAGEIVFLTILGAAGGASRYQQLLDMRKLREKVEARIAGGFWLDPFPHEVGESPN